MAAPSMNQIAERWAPHGVGSIFLYTHEAHPGEYWPHHTSFDQKLRHARALRDVLGVTRPILVDALDGACHRAYGGMPNMSWIINSSGVPGLQVGLDGLTQRGERDSVLRRGGGPPSPRRETGGLQRRTSLTTLPLSSPR